MKLIPLTVELQPNGHIFVLAAPSKEAFVCSYQQHFSKFAEELAYDCSGNAEDAFTRIRQASFIGGAYSTFTQ